MKNKYAVIRLYDHRDKTEGYHCESFVAINLNMRSNPDFLVKIRPE